MNIVIIEADNTIGHKIIESLDKSGFNTSYVNIQKVDDENKMAVRLKLADVIINISYHSIIENQISFSEEYINRFQKLISIVKNLEKKPSMFITTSFTAIYKDGGINSEMHISYGNNYLSNLSITIEDEASSLKDVGINPIVLRLPLVIDSQNFIKRISNLYRFKFRIKKIQPRAFLTWVSSNDIARALLFILQEKNINGVFNVVSPRMTNHKELANILRARHGISFMTAPKFIETKCMKNYIDLLDNLKVQPKRLLEHGFKFEDKVLSDYVNNLI